jgi:hypothetical protein
MPAPLAAQRRVDYLTAFARSVPGTAEATKSLAIVEQLRAKHPALNAPDLACAATWEDAVLMMIESYTRTDTCFTAAEIVCEIRLTRRDLIFGVRQLTRFVGEQVIEYDGEPAEAVGRTTKGSSRSGAGHAVTVWAPSVERGIAHDLEIEIPPPGGPLAIGGGA